MGFRYHNRHFVILLCIFSSPKVPFDLQHRKASIGRKGRIVTIATDRLNRDLEVQLTKVGVENLMYSLMYGLLLWGRATIE